MGRCFIPILPLTSIALCTFAWAGDRPDVDRPTISHRPRTKSAPVDSGTASAPAAARRGPSRLLVGTEAALGSYSRIDVATAGGYLLFAPIPWLRLGAGGQVVVHSSTTDWPYESVDTGQAVFAVLEAHPNPGGLLDFWAAVRPGYRWARTSYNRYSSLEGGLSSAREQEHHNTGFLQLLTGLDLQVYRGEVNLALGPVAGLDRDERSHLLLGLRASLGFP